MGWPAAGNIATSISRWWCPVSFFSTPAGATPMPDNPNRTVTSRPTVAPSTGLMMYARAPAGASRVGSAGLAAVASAATLARAKPVKNLRMVQFLLGGTRS
jgi:hypothetical protein